MKKFMAVYTGSDSGLSRWKSLDPSERARQEKLGMDAWGRWAEANKKAIVDQGAPLGKTKRISRDGITDFRNALAAYTIVEAESHEAAARYFLDHPHFTLFPGDAVEVMECLPLPKE